MKTEEEALNEALNEKIKSNSLYFSCEKDLAIKPYDFLKVSNLENKEEIIAKLDQIAQYINALRKTYENPAFRQLPKTKNPFKKIVIFFKRLNRKMLKWYIEPITEQQTTYNKANLECLINVTNLYIDSLERECQK